MATSSTPARFILSTDYATLKNDSDTIEISLVVPGSQVIPASIAVINNITFTANGTGGTAGSPMNITVQYGSNPTYSLTGVYQYATDAGTVLGSPAFYSVAVSVSRTAPNTFTLIASIVNPYSDPLTTEPTARTVTARISTFIPPFTS